MSIKVEGFCFVITITQLLIILARLLLMITELINEPV